MTMNATETDDARFAFRPTATKALRLFFEECIYALASGQIKDAVDVGMACRLLRDLVCAYSEYDEDAKDGFSEGMAGDYQPDEEFVKALHVPQDADGLESLKPSAGDVITFCVVSQVENGTVSYVNPNPWRPEEARAYCDSAASRGKHFAITRLDVNVALVGRPHVETIALDVDGEIELPVTVAGKFHVVVVNPEQSDSFYVTDQGSPISLPEALETIKLIDKQVQYLLLPAKAGEGMVPCDEAHVAARDVRIGTKCAPAGENVEAIAIGNRGHNLIAVTSDGSYLTIDESAKVRVIEESTAERRALAANLANRFEEVSQFAMGLW